MLQIIKQVDGLRTKVIHRQISQNRKRWSQTTVIKKIGSWGLMGGRIDSRAQVHGWVKVSHHLYPVNSVAGCCSDKSARTPQALLSLGETDILVTHSLQDLKTAPPAHGCVLHSGPPLIIYTVDPYRHHSKRLTDDRYANLILPFGLGRRLCPLHPPRNPLQTHLNAPTWVTDSRNQVRRSSSSNSVYKP